jgi:hypothetical protein
MNGSARNPDTPITITTTATQFVGMLTSIANVATASTALMISPMMVPGL